MNQDSKEVIIESMGFSLAPEEMTSDQIEQSLQKTYDRCKLSVGRLELMTGIRARRFWSQPQLPSEIAAEAGLYALQASQVKRPEIDGVIHAAVCRDRLEPATAAYVHKTLGLSSHAFFFDLSNACLGFLQALDVARSLILSGTSRALLVVAGEDGLPLVQNTVRELEQGEWTRKTIKPFFANLTIGSGAVAAVVTRADRVNPDHGIQLGESLLRADSQASNLCEGGGAQTGGLQMQTDSEALLIAGIELAMQTWKEFLQKTQKEKDSFDVLIPHQVGRSHEKMLGETLGYPMDRVLLTYPFLGNVGSVSLPITMALGIYRNQILSGHQVALMGIGSGLSCQMMEVTMKKFPPLVCGTPHRLAGGFLTPEWGVK